MGGRFVSKGLRREVINRYRASTELFSLAGLAKISHPHRFVGQN
jgi:hypothetical protein